MESFGSAKLPCANAFRTDAGHEGGVRPSLPRALASGVGFLWSETVLLKVLSISTFRPAQRTSAQARGGLDTRSLERMGHVLEPWKDFEVAPLPILTEATKFSRRGKCLRLFSGRAKQQV